MTILLYWIVLLKGKQKRSYLDSGFQNYDYQETCVQTFYAYFIFLETGFQIVT
jgi:hypothetical protein